jgi:hypothetical protein
LLLGSTGIREPLVAGALEGQAFLSASPSSAFKSCWLSNEAVEITEFDAREKSGPFFP